MHHRKEKGSVTRSFNPKMTEYVVNFTSQIRLIEKRKKCKMI